MSFRPPLVIPPTRWIITTAGGYQVTTVDININFSASEAEYFGAASPANYELRDIANNLITSPVTIPVPGSFEVFLHPVNDGIIEPPERLTLSITTGDYVAAADWLGVQAEQLNTIFPNLSRFKNPFNPAANLSYVT